MRRPAPALASVRAKRGESSEQKSPESQIPKLVRHSSPPQCNAVRDSQLTPDEKNESHVAKQRPLTRLASFTDSGDKSHTVAALSHELNGPSCISTAALLRSKVVPAKAVQGERSPIRPQDLDARAGYEAADLGDGDAGRRRGALKGFPAVLRHCSQDFIVVASGNEGRKQIPVSPPAPGAPARTADIAQRIYGRRGHLRVPCGRGLSRDRRRYPWQRMRTRAGPARGRRVARASNSGRSKPVPLAGPSPRRGCFCILA